MMKSLLKKAPFNLSISHFRVSYTKKNILLLKKLKPEDFLEANEYGGLFLCRASRSKRIAAAVKNAIFLGGPQKYLMRSIELTLLTFCHELKNPLDKSAHQYVWKKTTQTAFEIIYKLESLHFPAQLIAKLKEIVKTYDKASYLQARILSQVLKGVGDSRKKSSFWREAQLQLEPFKTPFTPKRGASGAYFIHGQKNYITGVFKPFDEEIGAPNNPTEFSLRGVLGSRSKGFGLCIGQGVHREVAAYYVDRQLDLNIVPRTCYSEFKHACFYEQTQGEYLQEVKTKRGSLQEFRPGATHFYQMSRREIEEIPADQMHRLLLLDLLIGNLDRNASNVLSERKKIIAIDHALSFAPQVVTGRFPIGVNWPQYHLPLFPILRKRIQSFDVEKHCIALKANHFIEEAALARMRERFAVLNAAVNQSLTLNQMAHLIRSDKMAQVKDLSSSLQKKAERLVLEYERH